MNDGGRTWALVLAAGEGTRLRQLTTNAAGVAIPKQFCSLRGGASLLHEALRRAQAVSCRERICTIVAESHRQWWEPALAGLPRENVIVQSDNRGTANGVLLPLLHIMERDPAARIALLPSDHHVRDERTLERSLERAVGLLAGHPTRAVLLGVEPEDVDPGLGYIVPGADDGTGARIVARFVEKPPALSARALITAGALWNVFIVAARAQALLDLFATRYPGIVRKMRTAVACDAGNPAEPRVARELYETLPEIDFSRHIAQGAEWALRVLTVPACGWSDLGTPARVARTLERLPARAARESETTFFPWCGQLNLAAQHGSSRHG